MRDFIRNPRSILAFLILLTPLVTYAHHSTLGFFDINKKVEIQGVLTNVTWRNLPYHF